MKKVLPLIIGGVVVLGAGAYFLSQNDSQQLVDQSQQQNQVNNQQEQTDQPQDNQETVTGSLKKILGLGRAMKCTWSREGAGSGTTWVKDGKFYNQVQAEGRSASVIYKNNCIWSWEEGGEQGVKMCFSPEKADEIISGDSEQTDQPTQGGTVPTDVDYNCQPTTVSDAKFNPPSGIEFMDMDQFMQGMQE